MTNKIKNIYAYNALMSARCELDQNYSFLLSTFLHIINEIDFGTQKIDKFSDNVLRAFHASNVFKHIDRVCLVVTHPIEGKLRVVSSCNSDRLKNNVMGLSYSCFVSSQSSLMRTNKTDVRIYSDINEIIKQYQGKPIQRSLNFLSQMGVKSGVTIPLNISGLFSGLLFLNSADVGAFDVLNDEDYAVLCLLKLIGESTLQRYLFALSGLDFQISKSLETLKTGNFFDINICKLMLTKVIEERYAIKNFQVTLERKGSDKEFFLSLKPKIYLLMKALEFGYFVKHQNELQIVFDLQEVDENNGKLEVKIMNYNLKHTQMAFMDTLNLVSNQQVRQEAGNLIFVFDVELAPDGVDYSV
jgi:hypothetical protein